MELQEYLPPKPRANAIKRGNPEELEELKFNSMQSAMALAREQARTEEDEDPDPYGYAQELEEQFGYNLLDPVWKSKPDDKKWVERLKSRARRNMVAKFYCDGFTAEQIAQKVKVSVVTVYKDIKACSQEWRRSYMDSIEILAARDLQRLDNMLAALSPGVNRGDTKSVMAAVEIIRERGNILGYRQGVQVDMEQYIREVATSKGIDPDRAVMLAQRISVTFK